MSASRELQVGDRIASYQLVSPIGSGGMGRVWVALDTVAPGLRLVAIKTALQNSDDRNFWAILSDEAGLASRIQHPNVCATYEFGDADGTHYLVMEWSDGTSLRDLLDALPTHRLEPVLAAHLIAAVAAGLHSAHELTGDDGLPLGVVHRDVSPQNVLLSLRGHVRLADFGVAKARGQAHRPTETGEVKGKLSYMSPEQVASKPIDRRSDVFGLGAVLYEVALGERPFHGADALSTMYKILEQELAAPRSIDPEFPPELESILLKSLVKDVDARYQSVAELREDLLQFVASTRRLVTDKLTAELLDHALGPSLRARNAAIIEVATRLRSGETAQARLASPRPPPPQDLVTPDGGIERSISLPHRQRRNSPRTLLFVAAALALLSLALVSVLVSTWRKPIVAPVSTVIATAALPEQPRAAVAAAADASPSASPAVAAPSVRSSHWHRVAPVRAPKRSGVNTLRVEQSNKAPGKTPRPIDSSNPFLSQ